MRVRANRSVRSCLRVAALLTLLCWAPATFAISTDLGGIQYTAACEANGVPVPPRFNFNSPGDWLYNGKLEGIEPSLEDGDSFVWVDDSMTTPGVCVAFPRVDAQTDQIKLVGVICQGFESNKACFWDGPLDEDTGRIMPISKNTTVCYSAQQKLTGICNVDASGGANLPDGPSEECSDCHAGENAFITHPNKLGFGNLIFGETLQDWLNFNTNWVEPIVKATWPQDAAPANYFLSEPALSECGGSECHGAEGRRRFPEISTETDRYCFRLLGQNGGTNVRGFSMPSGVSATYDALVAACSQPPGAGRLARHLLHHSAGRAPNTLEVEGVYASQALGEPYEQLQDSFVRPSIRRVPAAVDLEIDGDYEDEWDLRTRPHVVANTVVGDPVSDADLSAEWRGLWDDTYLYLFVTVVDSQRYTNSDNYVWQDDSVEIYIDGHRYPALAYNLDDFQYLFRPGDTDFWVGGGRSGMSGAGVLWAVNDYGSGYNVEVAIPWTTIGAVPGGQIGLEVHVNDDDGEGGDFDRDTQVSWRTTWADAWNNPSRFTAVDVADPLYQNNFEIEINGIYDEPTWAPQLAEPLNRQPKPIAPSNNSASWQTRWDADALYFFVSVEDEAVLGPESGAPYHDDSVEIFVDSSNGHDGPFDDFDDFQFIFRVGEADYVHLGDESAYTDTSDIDYAFQETADGYDLEVAIPWHVLKVAPADMASIGLEVQVNDDDNWGDREGKLSWCADTNSAYINTLYFCVKKLEGDAATPPRIWRVPRTRRLTTPTSRANSHSTA